METNLDSETIRPRTEGGISIGEISNRIRAKDVSPLALTNACLARIDELNPRLNAFITILGQQARDQAKQAEAEIKAGKWRGPLHGVPVGIKDFYDTAGIKTTAAFEKFKDRLPKKDAVAVAKLKQAGAIVVGKTRQEAILSAGLADCPCDR